MPPGSLFEFTSRFVPKQRMQQLLAVYALQQALATIPLAAIDDAVKWAKLKWWSEELAAGPASPARHPVLRAMHQSGARELLDNKLLQRLVSDAVLQMDVFPDADKETLFSRLTAQGETGILLELALDEVVVDKVTLNRQNLHSLALASGLFAMLAGFGHNYPEKIRQLPLTVLARQQVSVSRLQQQPPAPELITIITQLAGDGLEAFARGLAEPWLGHAAGQATHLQLRWAMEARRMAWIHKNAARLLNKPVSWGPADAWFAWRFCRGLRG